MFWTPTIVFIAQFSAAIVFGMAIPLFIAFQWWRKANPPNIPYIQCGILAALSLFFMFIFPVPVIGMGFAYLGGTPGASIGTTIGWLLTAISFWPSLRILHSRLKKKKKTT